MTNMYGKPCSKCINYNSSSCSLDLDKSDEDGFEYEDCHLFFRRKDIDSLYVKVSGNTYIAGIDLANGSSIENDMSFIEEIFNDILKDTDTEEKDK